MKKSVLSILLFAFAVGSAYSAIYEKGDFHLALRVPLVIPAFTSVNEQTADGSDVRTVYSFSETGHRNIVAGIEVDFGIFMTPKLSIGGLIGYNFAYDRGDKVFSKVPMLFRANYFVYSSHRVDVPLTVSAGISYFKYRSMEHIVPTFIFETGVNVYWDGSWGVVFRTGFWFYTELYAESRKNAYSGFIPIVLGVTYRR